jgi:hypothetical protein
MDPADLNIADCVRALDSDHPLTHSNREYRTEAVAERDAARGG